MVGGLHRLADSFVWHVQTAEEFGKDADFLLKKGYGLIALAGIAVVQALTHDKGIESPAFKGAAAALDANSVDLAAAISSPTSSSAALVAVAARRAGGALRARRAGRREGSPIGAILSAGCMRTKKYASM